LVLDGTTKATGNTTTVGQSYDLILSVDHPYYSSDFDESTTIKVVSGGFYQILNGWGNTGTEILKTYRRQLQQDRFDGQSDSSERVLGESYDILALTWLAQSSLMRTMAGGVGYSTVVNHHMVGVTGQTSSSAPPYISVPLGSLGIASYHTPVYRDTEEAALFQTVAGFNSSYEHAVIRQLQDCNAVSSVRLMDMANDRSTYDKIYYATSSNWSTVQGYLHNYSSADLSLISSYTSAGFGVYLPQEGGLTEQNWTGMGFTASKSSSAVRQIAYIVSGGNGGCASPNSALSVSTVFDKGYGANLGDSGDGAYTTGATDIAIGNGGYPYGLSFGRQYSSNRRLQDGPLGLGWTHSLDITALVQTDNFKFLGTSSPAEAAPQIAGIFAVWQLLCADVGSGTGIISMLSEAWVVDQMKKTTAVITQGTGKTVFAQDPNGSYIAPPGTSLKLVTNNGAFRLKNSSGIFNDFDSNGRLSEWSDAYGNKVDFTYTSGKLTQVAAKIGGSVTSRTLSFSYSGNHITTVTDSASRSVSYSYSGNELHSFTNLDSNSVTYSYHTSTDAKLTAIFSPISTTTPVVQIAYDSLGRMTQQTDANSCVWDFYLTPYRTEVESPAQFDPRYPTNPPKRFSTVSWGNPDTHQVTSTDVMGRTTTSTYDGQMQVTSVVNPTGTETDLTHDDNQNVTSTTQWPTSTAEYPEITTTKTYHTYEDATTGRWFVKTYEGTDAAGNVTRSEYDFDPNFSSGTNVGNLMKITHPRVNPPTDPNRAIETFTYYSTGQIHTKTDALGVVTHYEYNSAANGATLKKVIVDANGLNLTTQYTYDSVGRTITAIDPRGYSHNTEYHPSGLVRDTNGPADCSCENRQYEYYADGKVRYVMTKLNGSTVYLQAITYNNRGQKATTRGPYPSGASPAELMVNYTEYAYDALGQLWQITDAEGKITETRYYPDGKVWKVTNSENHATVNAYNTNGTLQKITDAEGNETHYMYDAFARPYRTTFADNTYEELEHNEYGSLATKYTRHASQIISFTFDNLNRVSTKSITDPNNTITYTYDLTGKLLRTVDTTGTTTYSYDNAGRLTSTTDAGGKTIAYQYDAGGNRTRLTYPDSTYITYEYDSANRLTYIKNSGGTSLAHYTYNALSQRTNLAYANGTNIVYDFDVAGRLHDINNVTVSGYHDYSYTYDNVGNRLSMLLTDNSGSRSTVYTYDNTYQLTDVNYPDSFNYLATDTHFNYDGVGNRTSTVDGGGTTSYSANSLNEYAHADGVTYSYDNSGNMTYDGSHSLYYDAANRLVKLYRATTDLSAACDTPLSFTTGGDAHWVKETTDYQSGGPDRDAAQAGQIDDDESTWLQTTVEGPGTISFFYQLSCGEGDYFTFSVDNQNYFGASQWQMDWHPISYTLGSGTHTLRWTYAKGESEDHSGDYARLDRIGWTGAVSSGGTWAKLEYVYDPSGRRIAKKFDGAITHKYVYDGDSIIAEYDGSNTLVRKYIQGAGIDQPVCMIDVANSSAVYYYHYDALGSVVALSNASGSCVETYEYSVFGEVAASDQTNPNPFMFTGREFDKETGLYFYRARYYAPEIGRFLQTDPIGYDGGLNLYWYCRNNPWTLTDPQGEDTIGPAGTTLTVGAIVEWTTWLTFPTVIGLNAHEMKLTATTWDGKTFLGQPHVPTNYASWFLWTTTVNPPGDVYSTYYEKRDDGNTITCLTATKQFRSGLAMPKPPGYPSYLPWIPPWVSSTITLTLCADGVHSISIDYDKSWFPVLEMLTWRHTAAGFFDNGTTVVGSPIGQDPAK
jgi:RHS repeat-associated protein